ANLKLGAAALRGFDDGTVTLNATGNINITGATAATTDPTSTSAGKLNLVAENILTDGGNFTTSGFATMLLDAAKEIRAQDDSTLAISGDLVMSTQRLTTSSGKGLTLAVNGTASLTNSAATDLATVTDLGGEFSLTADSIELASLIEVPSGIVNLQAKSGDVHLLDGAVIDVSGRSTQFADESISSGGGSIGLSSATADVVLDAESSLNVAAAGQAKSGSVAISAIAGSIEALGTLSATASKEINGGSFSADANSLGDISALNAQLAQGGFSGDLALRLRSGDLALASADIVRGTRVSLTADQGSVQIAGSIKVHDTDGGRITLSAGDSIIVSGSLDARATGSDERNGRIDLRVDAGELRVTDTAMLATVDSNAAGGSAADGTVSLRASQDSLLTVLDADMGNHKVSLAGDWSRTGVVNLEGFKTYSDNLISAADVTAVIGNVYYDDAAAFGSQAVAIGNALENSSVSKLNLLTGIEIQSTDTMNINAAWDLSQWRFAGQPGVLTLRSAGDLVFNQSLSDGFTGVTGTNAFKLTSTADSWSYRLIAGADLTAADVMAVRRLDAITSGNGDLLIASGTTTSSNGYKMVRTGNGSIDVNAARDVVLGNSASMIYTAGVATDGVNYAGSLIVGNELGGLKYPSSGGDINISAGRDVVGAASDQLITDWLWRIGNVDATTVASTRSTAWTVNFANFQQNIGVLGGGDLAVTAGRDLNTLSLALPSIGRQQTNTTNDKTAASNNLEVIGGGAMRATAGRDVLGGVFYTGKGTMDIISGGAVGASTLTGLNPILALGDVQAAITARLDSTIESAVTPTLLPQDRSQSNRGPTSSNFSTYTDNTALQVASLAGDVTLNGAKNSASIGSLASSLLSTDGALGLALRLLPGTVSLQSLRGDINLDGPITLAPTVVGRLEVLAYSDVNLNAAIIVSDADPKLLPGIATPALNPLITSTVANQALSVINTDYDQFNAELPVRLAAAQASELSPSRIVAASGDVFGSSILGGSQLYFGAPVQVYAGRDVVRLDLVAQNLTAADVSSVTAGRDISYGIQRNSLGGVDVDTRQIQINGPGQLTLIAGRDLNLQNSAGIISRGNLSNIALADKGANISVFAGINGKSPNYDEFTKRYLLDDDAYATMLSEFMANVAGSVPTDKKTALADFAILSQPLRASLLQQILLAELRASAINAASIDPTKNGDYSRGFTALETMFPGSTNVAGGAATNPYSGDISLYFSRIYTQDNGNITLIAPGGGVNAGLAAPPTSFGISKSADQLGIVTQTGGDIGIVTDQDLQVNESRVFAINNSDILVWSSNGNIDAGRGAKTAISAPTPVIAYDRDGYPTVTYSAALSGSGIQTRTTSSSNLPGDVVLAAPRGVVNAGDAGIVAGNLTIAATAVLGADNIKVSGVAVGVPVDTGGLGASLAGVTAAASGASNAASTAVGEDSAANHDQATSVATAALSWLEVFVVGLGDEVCRQDDLDCLKRQ
ncbi:MAG: filamentous hemagglutinin family protein, partial [Steroidobacteraceae bacterium]